LPVPAETDSEASRPKSSLIQKLSWSTTTLPWSIAMPRVSSWRIEMACTFRLIADSMLLRIRSSERRASSFCVISSIGSLREIAGRSMVFDCTPWPFPISGGALNAR
jgi:hypothetical protein